MFPPESMTRKVTVPIRVTRQSSLCSVITPRADFPIIHWNKKQKKSKFSQICQPNQFSRERDRLKLLPILIYQTIRWVTKRQRMEKKSTMRNQSTRMDMMSSRRTEREKRKPERLLQDVRFSSSRSSLRWKSIWVRVSGRKWPNCWAWQRRRWANELIKLFRRAHVSAKSLRVERWKNFEPSNFQTRPLDCSISV